jgi:hypothetical protein
MVQIVNLPQGYQHKSVRRNEAIGQALQMGGDLYQQHQQQQQAEQQFNQENAFAKQNFGVDLSGIRDPKMRNEIMSRQLQGKQLESEYGFKRQNENQSEMDRFNREQELQRQKYDFESQKMGDKLAGKSQEKIAPFQAALETVSEMRKIRKKNNLGRGSSIMGFFGGETAKDRGAYQTLGNSLISMASTIPIRNKTEFETLTGKINDPDITDAEAEGVLASLERIIKQNMQQYMTEDQPQGSQGAQPQKKPLTSFLR